MRFINDLCWLEIKFLQRINRESKKHYVRQRAHCILLSHQKYEVSELAIIFVRTKRTIYTWLDLWETKHFAGLYQNRGRGRKHKLDNAQKLMVKEWSKAHPKNLKKVVALVKEEYDILVSKYTVQRILHSFGFSWRRVRKKPKGEPDPTEYNQKREVLRQFQQQAKQDEIDLYYFDETGFSLNPLIPYAWQEKGNTIELESSRGKRLSVCGFLSLQKELLAYTTETVVDSDFVIACFDEFIKSLTRKTVVSMDNSSFHTSESFEAKIPEWQSKNLEIFYLPKYSPQLNLIEILWRFMKYQWIEWWAYKGWSYLVEYVEKVIRGYGTEYEIIFA